MTAAPPRLQSADDVARLVVCRHGAPGRGNAARRGAHRQWRSRPRLRPGPAAVAGAAAARRPPAADNRPLDLTRLEALALQELVRAAGQAVVKDTLEDRLYGFNDDVGVNALEAVISRLRRRLAAAGSAVSIESLRGIGYRLRMGGPA